MACYFKFLAVKNRKLFMFAGERKVKVRKPNVTGDNTECVSIKRGESRVAFGVTSVLLLESGCVLSGNAGRSLY